MPRYAIKVYIYIYYIGPKSITERPRKTKIGTEVAHVTCESDATFKVKRSKVNLLGRGHIVPASSTACCYRATLREHGTSCRPVSVCPSVCLSSRLSLHHVGLLYPDQTAEDIIRIFSRSSRTTIPVS